MLSKRTQSLTNELNTLKKQFISVQHDTSVVEKEIQVLELESKLNTSMDQARIFEDLYSKVQKDLTTANSELISYRSMTQSFILKDLP